MAFRNWVGAISFPMPEDRRTFTWLRASASLIAKRACQYDAKQADAAWARLLAH